MTIRQITTRDDQKTKAGTILRMLSELRASMPISIDSTESMICDCAIKMVGDLCEEMRGTGNE
jgi:hypothetical protein